MSTATVPPSDSPATISAYPDLEVSTVDNPPVPALVTSGHVPSALTLELSARGVVEPGDVLVADTERIGSLHRSDQAADPAVIGIATSDVVEGQVLVAVSGIVECHVDAGFGAVKVGDLLTVSPTPGHAMLAMEHLPGTILGKALEPLDSGTSLVRVLVMLR